MQVDDSQRPIAVFFALTNSIVGQLASLPPVERGVFIAETLDRRFALDQPQFVASIGESWHPIHAVLSSLDESASRRTSLAFDVFQGDSLPAVPTYEVVTVTGPDQVERIADALANITRDDFERGYRADGLLRSERDSDDVWGWFQHLVSFYTRAAANHLHVLFTR